MCQGINERLMSLGLVNCFNNQFLSHELNRKLDRLAPPKYLLLYIGVGRLGSRQTSAFHNQYFDKKKRRYCNILIKQYFLVKILLFLFKISWNNHDLRFSIHTTNKKMSSSQYRYTFLSQYCLQKLLVWREP